MAGLRRSRRYARRRPRVSRAVVARMYRRVRPRGMTGVHIFKRTTQLSAITASISSLGVQNNIATAYQFNLNQLPNATEFTNLFDQYKILKAKISFVPGGNMALISPLSGVSSSFGFGRFLSAIDYDDATAPADENTLLQYEQPNLKITSPMRTHTRYINPKVLAAIYQSAISTSYESRKAPWLDVGNPSVPHYGLKVWVNAPLSTVAASITYNVYLTLTFATKNVR